MKDLYTYQRNRDDPEKWDVVRNEPTIVASALKMVEAEALAFAMNVQVRLLEGRK